MDDSFAAVGDTLIRYELHFYGILVLGSLLFSIYFYISEGNPQGFYVFIPTYIAATIGFWLGRKHGPYEYDY